MKGVPMNWDTIQIKNVRSFKTNHRQNQNDRCRVILEMPAKEYTNFRKMIETAHIHDRRKNDHGNTGSY